MGANQTLRLICVTALLVTVCSGPAVYATNGMRLIGFGPVQRSMGGSSVGLPLDAATTITNPAGMSLLERRLDAGVSYFSPDVSYKAHSDFGMVTNDNDTISSERKPCYIPAVGVILPINEEFTFGLGAYCVCGMGVDYKKNLYHNVTYTSYGIFKIAPAIAYSVSDKLSVGTAINIDYGMMEYEAGTPFEVPHDDGKEFGLGFTIGVLRQITDKVSVGVAYESKQAFSDFEFDTTGGTDKISLDQPQNITIGLGIRPSERLRVGFDVMWIDWPQTVGKNKPEYTQNSSGAAAWNMNWDEQYVYKFGVEYDLNDKIRIRGGYNYGKNPLDKSRAFENISFPAVAEHHITAGAGIDLRENLILNLGFVYAPKVSLDTANAAQVIDSATTEMSQYSFDVGISYMF